MHREKPRPIVLNLMRLVIDARIALANRIEIAKISQYYDNSTHNICSFHADTIHYIYITLGTQHIIELSLKSIHFIIKLSSL